MIKAVIFDFDGLILETEGPCYQSWNEIYRLHGNELDLETYIGTIGSSADHFDPYEHLERTLGYPVDRHAVRIHRRKRHLELSEAEAMLPGVMETILDAKKLGLKIGLASSSSQEWVEGHLRRLDLLPYFDTVQTADNVDRTKPEPDLYLAAVKALEISPCEGLALEDSPNGVLAAKRAGLYCIAVPGPLTCHLDFGLADRKVEFLTDISLAEALKSLAGDN